MTRLLRARRFGSGLELGLPPGTVYPALHRLERAGNGGGRPATCT